LFARGGHDEAATVARHALEIDPDYGTAHWALAASQVFAGDWDVGCRTAERAVDIDPQDPFVHLYGRTAALGHFGAGRLDEAAAWFQRCDHLAPGLPQNLAGLAAARALLGEIESARQAATSLREAEPELEEYCPLPYRNPADWSRFAAALRLAGGSG
jgi:tetratricopeptide (TPR) repeat protein